MAVWILRTVMYQSEEPHPGLSQAFKINLFTRIVDVFKLTLLIIFAKLPSWMFEDLWLHLWATKLHLIKCFSIREKTKQFWPHQICKLYQNIKSRLLFMIDMMELTVTFSLFYLFDWKLVDLMLFFLRVKMCAPKKSGASQRFWAPVQFVQACRGCKVSCC